ncbi:MAG: hypothetical protein IPM46_11725 [Flavobacteriales bacterium]|nr:hypothetical protein [Flavobacteriales bacterium]
MRNGLLVIAATLALVSCRKEDEPDSVPADNTPTGPVDYRDVVEGEYVGIDTCSSGTWGGPGGDPVHAPLTFTVVKDSVNSVQVRIDGWPYILQEDQAFSYVSGSVLNHQGAFTPVAGGAMRLQYSRAYNGTGNWSSCQFTGTKN